MGFLKATQWPSSLHWVDLLNVFDGHLSQWFNGLSSESFKRGRWPFFEIAIEVFAWEFDL